MGWGVGWFAQSFSCQTQPLCCVGVGVLTIDNGVNEQPHKFRQFIRKIFTILDNFYFFYPCPPPIPAYTAKKKYTYVGNICDLHGAGAKLKGRPTRTKATTPGGKPRIGREYYQVCDVGLGEKKLFQPRISSLMMTPGNKKDGTQEGTSKNNFITHTVGQLHSDAQKRAGINVSEDTSAGEISGAE